jgi:hypothetical protein
MRLGRGESCRFLFTIGLNLQGIIDPIDQIGQGNYHGQLNDFILGIIPSNIP